MTTIAKRIDCSEERRRRLAVCRIGINPVQAADHGHNRGIHWPMGKTLPAIVLNTIYGILIGIIITTCSIPLGKSFRSNKDAALARDHPMGTDDTATLCSMFPATRAVDEMTLLAEVKVG